jgi:hypothetical protein
MLPNLRNQLTKFAHLLQTVLFPRVEEETGSLSDLGKSLMSVLTMLPLERYIPVAQGWNGRPPKSRLTLASAFVAKAVYNFPTTRDLLERLHSDTQLCRICGWESPAQVPHESTFSRAFAEFAEMELPQLVQEALIQQTQRERLVGHIARDSTAIEVRERFPETAQQRREKRARKKAAKQNKKKQKSGRRRKGEPITAKEQTRLQRQRKMTLSQMLAELPRQCDIGVKTSSKGYQHYWRGYKLHLDVADGQIPISAVLTSASVHDSQVAIPLATMSAQRTTSLYDLMDAAYDAGEIHAHSRSLGHVPIIDPAQRIGPRKSVLVTYKQPRQFSWAQQERYKERSMSERVNARLKDEFGGRFIRVRGAQKVMAHLMFGVLALTVDQLLRLGT